MTTKFTNAKWREQEKVSLSDYCQGEPRFISSDCPIEQIGVVYCSTKWDKCTEKKEKGTKLLINCVKELPPLCYFH